MEPTSKPRYELHICIVNWRTAVMAINCLRSIADERSNARVRVVVVDNASGDGSDAQILGEVHRNGWEDWVEVISSGRNGGFAYGNNLAIRAALAADPGAPFVLLLNPDTLVRPGALRILLDFMANHPQAGLAGGRSEDSDGTPQHCAFRFMSPASEFAAYARVGVVDRILARWKVTLGIPVVARPVDWVSGAVLMIRRDVIDQIGLLDEGYFLYFEETDFILRARKAGWTCWHVPESRVVHFVGQSSGVNSRNAAPRRLPVYWFESRRRYFTLNHGRLYAVLADAGAMAGHLVWQARQLIRRLPAADPPNFVGDLWRHGAILNGQRSMATRKINR
jgi:N-acetylglucosaminyl-diphospho-decaprenol L-rhamnosyltransferase